MIDKLKQLRLLAKTASVATAVARKSRWILGNEVIRLTVKTAKQDAQFTIAQLAKATAKDCGKSVTAQEKFLSEAKFYASRFKTLKSALKGTIRKAKSDKKTIKPKASKEAKKVAIMALDLTQAEFAYVIMEFMKK